MSKPEDERIFRRFFQDIKSMTLKNFIKEMNVMHTRAYAIAQRHHEEAMFICLTPKLQEAVKEKVIQIREEWDGMATVTTEDTKGEVFMTNDLIQENKALKERVKELEYLLGGEKNVG